MEKTKRTIVIKSGEMVQFFEAFGLEDERVNYLHEQVVLGITTKGLKSLSDMVQLTLDNLGPISDAELFVVGLAMDNAISAIMGIPNPSSALFPGK
jgi:hypothetical protein